MRSETGRSEDASSAMTGGVHHEADGAPHPKKPGFVWRQLLPLALGAVLLLIGVALVAFAPLRNSISNSAALERAESLSADLVQEWEDPTDMGDIDLDKVKMSRPLGKGFAFIYIPRLGKDWRAVVVEGVDQPDLEGAVGHFPETADPGIVGNFALAGHRNMDGSLFGNLDQVMKGDTVIIETRDRWITYTVTDRQIISPYQVEVLEPVPYKPGKPAEKAFITLTTCHPWWSSAERLALVGELSDVRLKTMTPPKGVSVRDRNTSEAEAVKAADR